MASDPRVNRAGMRPSPALTVRHIVEWDVRNWSRALPYWERHTSLQLQGARALEVGARRGGLSLWLARKGCQVTCSDVVEPTKEVQDLHRLFGFGDQIRYAAVDVLSLPFENQLDIVCLKSVLGAVGARGRADLQSRAVAEMYRALRTGGELWFAENLAASRLHQLGRRTFVPWGTACRYVSIPELEALLGPFARIEYATTGFLGAFGRTELQRNILGTLDQAFVSALVPRTWRYVAFGIALKS